MKIRKSDNKGFTLVELIVVLVILAILAAILVPALLGYIDEAKKKQDLLDAKACLTAAQAEFTKQYAKRTTTDTCAVSGYNEKLTGSGKDVDFREKSQTFPDAVFEKAGVKPYIFVTGLGKYETYIKTDKHKVYTVYFAMYQSTKDAIPIYFDGNEWSEVYPWKKNGNSNGVNKFNVNGTDIDLQLYILSAPGDNGYNFWETLRQRND